MDKIEILNEIKKLPEKDQLLIVEIILESLDSSDSKIKAAWAEEASKRLKAVKAGEMRTVSGVEVMEKARQILRGDPQN